MREISPNDVTAMLSRHGLTDDERQLLKDAIYEGAWGDTDMPFLRMDGTIEELPCYGYCTNDARRAGNFSGRRIPAIFRSLYRKLCPAQAAQVGPVLSHANDWWGDGTGDMLFIRLPWRNAFERWARS